MACSCNQLGEKLTGRAGLWPDSDEEFLVSGENWEEKVVSDIFSR